jgi:hypothetical protein
MYLKSLNIKTIIDMREELKEKSEDSKEKDST